MTAEIKIHTGRGADLDKQMLAAHLQQADPIMYDVIEKVCLFISMPEKSRTEMQWLTQVAQNNRRKSGKSSSST